MATKRKDKSRVVLKTGEVQRKDGTYQFSWQDSQMKRRFVYARTLDDLREKEKRIQKDKCDGIKTEARYTTIDELFDLWANMKRGLKNNTFENYFMTVEYLSMRTRRSMHRVVVCHSLQYINLKEWSSQLYWWIL